MNNMQRNFTAWALPFSNNFLVVCVIIPSTILREIHYIQGKRTCKNGLEHTRECGRGRFGTASVYMYPTLGGTVPEDPDHCCVAKQIHPSVLMAASRLNPVQLV